MSAISDTVGVLLAGGLARRMGGGDKPLRTLGGHPILDYVVARARTQVADLLLNVNGDAARFASYGLPMAGDVIDGYAGPLAGILTGMEWARDRHPEARWIASFATDAPFIPADLVPRLRAAIDAEGADIACAMSGARTHPVFAVWPVALADELRAAMVDEDMRKIDAWSARYKTVEVDFPTLPYDPFFNINKPDNLAEAEALIADGRVEVPA